MKVSSVKSFAKDLKKLPAFVLKRVFEIIKVLETTNSLEESNLDYKKMKGAANDENYYRIRIGDYRIGIELKHPDVILIRVLARGEIYKYFP
ncbi:type II toxin-antitoxin system RelE family toxin [Niabella ginsengisoli]|uniref:Type II toxin-antitoxin system RelE/ParE family toxin n=1 Tax=Niabella ginsengisoli TaxID=522298 RepID=A0ABS9SGY6_9BACT|nr:type II toxin-antitoxin system RelE/ParE family toxin [Niabella ginsengisoli]MCH5597631.1 type II toxin-antitoxin system RelE/ParE family toxin [Niabella ginsengisoli]